MKRRLCTVVATALVGRGIVAVWADRVDGQGSRPAASGLVQHYDGALLSKPTYKVRVEKDVKFPAVLVRSPYSNNPEGNISQSKCFAERGYVDLYQDVRGKYDSKSDFYPFRHGPTDGYDTDDYDPNNPVPTLGGNSWCAAITPVGPWDQRAAERRDDVLVFTSEVRVEVSSSNVPRFDRNLNIGEDTATGSRMEVAHQTIHHSAQYPSHLVLPIVPRDGKITTAAR